MFSFFEPFRPHLHTKFRKSANKSKKNFSPKYIKGIKNAEFHADFKYVDKDLQEFPVKKVISKNVTEMCTFLLLLMFIKLVWLITNKKIYFVNVS
jgi:hypothetical protein